MRTWSLEFFANEFADFPVTAYAPQFSAFALCGVQTTVASYVAYLRNPADARIDGTSDWTTSSSVAPRTAASNRLS